MFVGMVDRLAQVWSQRNRGQKVTEEYRELTQEDRAMDLYPSQHSDQLDYGDKLNDRRNWIHRECYQVRKSETPDFAQAKREYYAIVNLYSACSQGQQQQYQQQLIGWGYSEEEVRQVPLMIIAMGGEEVDMG